jgi:hypothetical protein
MQANEFVSNKISLGYTRDEIITALQNANYTNEEISSCQKLLDGVAKDTPTKQQENRKNTWKILGYIAIGLWIIFKIFGRIWLRNND